MALKKVALATLVAGGSSVVLVAMTGAASGAAPPVETAAPDSVSFPGTTLGAASAPESFTLTNNSASEDTIDFASSQVTFSGPGADDYLVLPVLNCSDGLATAIIPASGNCVVDAFFLPGGLGPRPATMTIVGSADEPGASVSVSLEGTGTIGYYQVDQQGRVAHAGDAAFFGDASGTPLNKPIVGMAATGDDTGYWLVASDGGIFNYGLASFFGSTGSLRLNKPIVGMAPTLDAQGYWLVASDGGIFNYGDAAFYGSTGSLRLNKPIVGMAPTPDGGGYWLVASDGGIFNYGDAGFHGSTGSIALNKPIVGMAPTPDGGGYWLVASDGGIFAFGDAQFYGSTGSIHLAQPIVAMAAMPDGSGYWFSAADGGLFNYGSAPFYGSAVGHGLGPVVDMVTDGSPTLQGILSIPAMRAAQLSPRLDLLLQARGVRVP